VTIHKIVKKKKKEGKADKIKKKRFFKKQKMGIVP
jgi:hypothetical protein